MSVFNITFFRFLFVGVGSNAINFIIYISLYFIGLPLFSASMIGYVVGLLFSYHFGRVWVFGRNFEVSKASVFSFCLVYTVGGLGMSSIINLFVRYIDADYRIAWIIGATFAVFNNYIGLKRLVFNKGLKK